MVGIVVMLREIISFVETALSPVYGKLALTSTVSNPVKSHVDCFCSLLLDGGVGDAGGSGVVSGNWSGGLGMAKFFQGDA
jgi:hypothetical protein